MVVDTQSPRVVRSRKMLAELLVAAAPQCENGPGYRRPHGIDPGAVSHGDQLLHPLRPLHRMCSEQMGGRALGFSGRGIHRRVQMPFQTRPETCGFAGAAILSARE